MLHKTLTQEKWNSLTEDRQILNIASELTRAKNWIQKNDFFYRKNSLERALELFDLTANDKKWRKKLKELLRLREAVGKFYLEKNKDLDEFLLLIKTFFKFNKITENIEV